jgi:hypothetical protein
VIGEYEWAFYGGHYASMAPLFEHYGIQLWTHPHTGQPAARRPPWGEELLLATARQVEAAG